jgi:hypothetical protein
MKYLFAFPLFALFALSSCADDDDSAPITECGQLIEIVSSISGLDSGDGFAISSASVEGLCLSVEVNATGCNPEEWTAELITNGNVAESTPTQSIAQFVFDNHLPEDSITCLALSFKTFTFDLSPYLSSAIPSNFELLGQDTSSMVLLVE